MQAVFVFPRDMVEFVKHVLEIDHVSYQNDHVTFSDKRKKKNLSGYH